MIRVLFIILSVTCLFANNTKTVRKNPMIELTIAEHDKTVIGKVDIELYPDKAPHHVERILKLVNEGFYDGLYFHRVIAGFMVQTGSPRGDGTDGSKYPDLKAEFNDIKHVKGVVSMARAADINSANSQFFIMLGTHSSLDGQYTAFGRVVKGMEYIEKIRTGSETNNGMVDNPSMILKAVEIK